MCRAAGAAGEAAPRPYTDGSARRRCDRYLQRWGRIPRPVGVRRCLTRRPRGPAIPRCADRPGTGEIVYVVDTRHANLPHRRRGGQGGTSPLHGVGGGSAVDPRPASVGGTAPSCRGQAHARGWLWISVFVQPPCVGVRRCLTRRPAAAGKPDRGWSGYRGRVIHTGTFAGVHVATLPGAAPVDGSRVFLAPRAHRPVPTASPCRLLTASPLGEPRRLSG